MCVSKRSKYTYIQTRILLTSKVKEHRDNSANDGKHGSHLIKGPEPMPDAHLGEEEGLVVVARARQRVHTMPPEPGKQRNQAAHLERVDERRRLALPVRHAADAHLGQQQRQDGEDLDRLQDGGAVGLDGAAGGLLQEVDEDDAGG
jgi:hypothetical protein